MIKDLASLRKDYKRMELEIESTEPDPIFQFKHWFEEALASNVPEPNAMILATVDKAGLPSARVVLLKGFDVNGFVFFTNYQSEKGQAISENPHVAMVFNWLELERQVRIEGVAEKLPFEESEAYFQSRPRESQIGAWASPQSSAIKSKSEILERATALDKEYPTGGLLPCPPHWGGYLVVPVKIEFWQGRPGRLHDRILYRKAATGKTEWEKVRLAP